MCSGSPLLLFYFFSDNSSNNTRNMSLRRVKPQLEDYEDEDADEAMCDLASEEEAGRDSMDEDEDEDGSEEEEEEDEEV